MQVLIVTPAPRASRTGNRVTALRWAAMLRSLGHRVRLRQAYEGEEADLLLALHATKSAASIDRWLSERPWSPLLVALTGTDIYDRLGRSGAGREGLGAAWRLIVLQHEAAREVPERTRSRVRVIVQSARAPAGTGTGTGTGTGGGQGAFDVCVMGHLRPVKDPFRAAEAARLLPRGSRVRIVHVGGAMSPEMDERARREMAENPRYVWLGELRRRRALAVLARSRLLAVTSVLEGGANVVSEAIAAGVPVVHSRIPGGIGLLGPDYPGYFEAGDAAALAALIERAEADAAFHAELKERCARLAPLVDPARERAAWASLLDEVGRERARRDELRRDVAAGLGAPRKRLPCRWFYDEEGSRLFEEICALPAYYIPAAEREILSAHAGEIAALAPEGATLHEFGSGDGAKTRILIGALLGRFGRLRYAPLDLSRSALEDCAARLRREFPSLEVDALEGEYAEGVARLEAERERPKLVLWLGSNIGNLRRDEAAGFLRALGQACGPADRLLVGIDLRKDRRTLEAAYDDPEGLTARFNRNILARVARELGGRFEPEAFRHVATYDEEEGVVRMFLVASRDMVVPIEGLGIEVSFAAGEAIHTEDSVKYSAAEIERLAAAARLRIERSWTDSGGRFRDVVLAPRTPRVGTGLDRTDRPV